MKIGFVGLGIMGMPMAKNLMKYTDVELYVYDINNDAVDRAVRCGAKASSLEEIGKKCNVIFLILPNGMIVQNVIFGEHGIAKFLETNSIIVDMSSVTPQESRNCALKLSEKGVRFLDAPVSGGEPKAIDGTLAFMVGGKESDFQEIYHLLKYMGASSVHVGPVGAGSVAKLVNQIIVNLNIAAVSEAFVLGTKAGCDPIKIFEAIQHGLAGSAVLDAKIPLIVSRNFKPGGKISINHKDIKNALATAHELNAPVPFTSQLFEIFQTMKVHGYMDMDHGFLVHYFEQLADIEVKGAITNV